MKAYSHWVIMFNHKTKKFTIDYETTEVRFSDGQIYNEDKDEWEESAWVDEEVANLHYKAGHALASTLETVNCLSDFTFGYEEANDE